MSRGNSRSHVNSWIGYCRLAYHDYRLQEEETRTSFREALRDVPRAGVRTVLFSEVISPILMAVLFVIAYMFIKSFPNPDGKYPPSPIVRIAVNSLGPIVWNAAILLVLFLVSLFLGPMLNPTFPKFGSVIAFIAHVLGVIGMIGFFKILVSFLGSTIITFISNHSTIVVP